MGAIVGLAVAIVLVAAERPSVLSGPAQRGFPGWMVGPLAHRLPALPDSPPMLQADLTRALAVLGIAWLVAVLCAPRVPSAIVWSAVVATHVILLLGPPLSLTDVFNYLHYGRMPATYGVNPYAALPLTVRQDPAYHFSNWHHLPSPYGPLLHPAHRGPRAARRCPPPTGRGRRRRWPPRSAPSRWWLHGAAARALAAGRGRARRASTRSSSSTASAAPHNEPLVLLLQRRRGLAGRRRLGRTGAPWWDVGAGACAVLAAGFKPSAALLAPVVVLACRRRLPALGGAGGAGALVLARGRAASTAATCPRRASRTGSWGR